MVGVAAVSTDLTIVGVAATQPDDTMIIVVALAMNLTVAASTVLDAIVKKDMGLETLTIMQALPVMTVTAVAATTDVVAGVAATTTAATTAADMKLLLGIRLMVAVGITAPVRTAMPDRCGPFPP